MSSSDANRSTNFEKVTNTTQFKKGSKIAFTIGIIGTAIAFIGFFIAHLQSPDAAHRIAMSVLIAFTFWLAIILGTLFLVMFHHIFDAGWSTAIRRPLEHFVAAIPWLGIFFIPLVLLSLFYNEGGFIWKWMATETASQDVLYIKKAGYLNITFFVIRAIFYFVVWIGLGWALRKGSFSQDRDGKAAWTGWNRKFSAAGIILTALTLTFAAFDWIKGLDYHWFSTMFGVWYFAGGMRGALSILTIACVLLVKYGPLRGIFTRDHLYEIGRLQLAFTVFWAYIAFCQYFLIYNADIPEETFWFVVRESGNWMGVGMVIIFCQFLIPFVYLLFYKNKVLVSRMILLSVWLLVFQLVEIYFYVLPTKLDNWVPVYNFPIFDVALITDLAAVAGIGGICAWAFLRSLPKEKMIPIRDPRILESVKKHG